MAIETFSVREPQEGEITAVLRNISAPVLRKVEPVGSFYERLCKTGRVRTTSVPPSVVNLPIDEEQNDDDFEMEDSSNAEVIPACDPKDWKEQDHYEILGIGSLRLQATEEQIKKAYKRKVLKFHPDKRRAQGLPVQSGEEAYFACITKAYEILSNPKKRLSYDSVDPTCDDSVPSVLKDPSKFYSVFRPVFQRNARWSINKPVPELGDETSSFEDVNDFYSFWLDFESWREFSYLDEEDKQKGENRDERRWIEKQNKAERQKRRKEEVARIRELVDNAYASDPRIVKFKEEERQKKLAIKQAKQEAIAKAKAEENEKKRQQQLEEERKQQEKEEEEKAQAAAIKKEKEEQKKLVKKERKRFRTLMKEFNYFTKNETEVISRLEDSDKLAEFLPLERLQKLTNVISANGNSEGSLKAFIDEVTFMNNELEAERNREAAASQKKGGVASDKDKNSGGWSEEEIQLLVKAVNLFPAGTVSRWETVAAFINQHHPGKQRYAKDVLAQAKSFQKIEANQKDIANKQAFDRLSKNQKTGASVDTSDISERYMSVAEQQAGELGSNPAPWTAKEQKVLEQAMRIHGADVPDRWDKIAEMIPSRTKKDCMKRYKELCDMVRAKKLAQATATGK